MPKAPWEENNYEIGSDKLSRTKRKSSSLSIKILTFLAVTFFIILLLCIFLVIYTSTGGSRKGEETAGFYQGSTVVAEAPVEDETPTEESEETVALDGDTITVNAGEGEASIAARAGISIAELEALNPEHMVGGSWSANPGDEIKIK